MAARFLHTCLRKGVMEAEPRGNSHCRCAALPALCGSGCSVQPELCMQHSLPSCSGALHVQGACLAHELWGHELLAAMFLGCVIHKTLAVLVMLQ